MFKTVKKYITTTDGILLYYEIYLTNQASKPQVFLLHGIGGDLDAWQYVNKILLANNISILAMDLRGHGFSTHPLTSPAYQIDNLVNDIMAIMQAEKIEKINLIGHCYGAVIAKHFALKFPFRLNSLVLVSSTYRPPKYLSNTILLKLVKYLSILFAWFSPPPIYPGHSFYPPGKIHKDYEIFGLIRTILRNSWRSYLLTSLEILKLNILDKLAKINIPTLIIVGNKDSIFPLEISQNINKKISNSKLIIIPDGLHNVVLNNSNEVAEEIIKFIK